MTNEYQDLKQQVDKLKDIVDQHNTHFVWISQVFPRLSDEEQHQSQYEQRVEVELSKLNQQVQDLQAKLSAAQQVLHDPSNSKFDTIWVFQRFLLRLVSISSVCSIDLTNQRKFAS